MQLTETKRTLQDFEYLVDDFDTENSGNMNYFGKVTIAGMVMISHMYIQKAGKIPQDMKDMFKHHFPMLTPKEWYHIANAFIDFYLGSDVKHPCYKINLNKHVATYRTYKELNNKYNDLKID